MGRSRPRVYAYQPNARGRTDTAISGLRANMAVRASILQSGTQFDSSIGPSSGNYAMGKVSRAGRKARPTGT